MAPTVLPVLTINEQGIPTAAGVAADIVNGNAPSSNNGKTTFIKMVNTVASVATVTLPYANKVDGKTVPPQVYNLPPTIGAGIDAGPFPLSLFGSNPVFTASAVTVQLQFKQI